MDFISTPDLVTGFGNEVLIFCIICLIATIITLCWLTTEVNFPGSGSGDSVLIRTIRIRGLRIPPNLVLNPISSFDSDENTSRGTNEDMAEPQSDQSEIFSGDISRTSSHERAEADENSIPSQGEEAIYNSDETATTSDDNQSNSNEENVTIKIKFMNDTIREVRAALSDSIGRFTRRNFAIELAANKRIKLIFNGRWLNVDEETLSQCGLFDNCVIHCIIPTISSNNNSDSLNDSDNFNVGNEHFEDLDLSNFSYPLLGSVLLIIWWCQFIYSHYFSITSSFSLIFLTLLYAASIVSTYAY